MTPELRFHRAGPIAIVAVSYEAALLAQRVCEKIPHATLWCHRQLLPEAKIYSETLRDFFGEIWKSHAAIIAFMASGIVVRSCAPWIDSKLTDPAVVVVDDIGRHAISLLSGHEGEANALTEDVAEILGALPVITTGSETRRRLVVGVGCRRGISGAQILETIHTVLAENNLTAKDIYALATIDLKADEPGIHEAARALGAQVRIIPRERIRVLQDALRDTSFAESITGVAAVCVPAAILASHHSQIRINRVARTGVTVAIAEDACGLLALGQGGATT